MTLPLKVLVVEDNEQDAALVVRTLSKGGFEVEFVRVETAIEMEQHLSRQVWDVVISDYSLPNFSALAALQTMHELGIDLPFIIVSGTIDEDAAVEAIRAGAHDFMSKGRFARLVPAIEREMREARVRAESVKLRQQLLISDRMASMGTLAAGVAHEVNNPLTAIIGGLELASEELMNLGLERPLRLVEEARHAAERVRRIVGDLKAFSRSDDETTGPVDIEQAIDASIRMIQHEVKHHARLTTVYGHVPLVQGNEARLGQVFLNLILNAAQAMPMARVEDNEIVVETLQTEDGRVQVEVRDNGPGIPDEIKKRIFDPFFTTKPIGTGTGLGLTICHRIVTELGGEISVETSLGRGTTFRTLLPVHVPSLNTNHAEPPPHTPLELGTAHSNARILVIDDEAVVGQLVGRMLADAHEVTVMTDARRALEMLNSGVKFDAILCDLMMPDTTGMDVYEELIRLPSEVRPHIAFMSGGAFTKEARDFLDRVPCPHLEKPFNRTSLNAVLQELLS